MLRAAKASAMASRISDGESCPGPVSGRAGMAGGAALFTIASNRELTVSVGATQINQTNIYAGFVQPLVEPLIPNNRWYLFADPPTAPVYVYGYLNGAEGPQVTTGPVSGVDGVEVSVIFDFGVGAIDWRGAWFNPGA
jgi:hypothetical protein